MSILVIGSTGHIGTFLVQQLAGAGSEARGLTRDSSKARFPAGVQPVQGDTTDVASMRTALAGVSTVFVLNPVVPDELTRALLTLNLAAEAA